MKRSKYLALVALAVLLLSACSSAVAPTATQAPAQEQPTATDRPAAETSAPDETPTRPPATATEASPAATATEEPQPPTQEPQSATDTPEPEDVFAFLQVGPDEWVHGPADAPVTIVEYVDFQ
jgi:uncharacterized lipoprotein